MIIEEAVAIESITVYRTYDVDPIPAAIEALQIIKDNNMPVPSEMMTVLLAIIAYAKEGMKNEFNR